MSVVVERVEAVTRVVMNRPETLNALTYPMLAAFREAVDAAVTDTRVVGIVVTGEGRGFCSGLDASVLQATATAGSSTRPKASNDVPGLFTWLLRVPKPVISAVNGVAAGGGFVLTAMSDIRIASTAGSFTTIFSKRGLIAEHGMTWLVPRLLGIGNALDLLWTSRLFSAARQGSLRVAAERHRALATGAARCVSDRSPRRATCSDGGRSRRQSSVRRAAKPRPPQRAAGAAALIEKRGPSFPRLGA